MAKRCIECGSSYVDQYYEEVVPCSHCGENTVIDYFACSECGIMWKEVDGIVIDNSKSAMKELDEFFDTDVFSEAVEFFDEELLKLDKPKSMQDLVHKCIKCNTVAYEVKPGKFHCPDCGFEWEIF
jgi:predicted  nucleic acid-binding Zn-ribbon protein